MIHSKSDLKYYIREDAKRNDVSLQPLSYLAHLFVGSGNYHSFRYLKCLRHCEYHLNNSGLFHKICFQFFRFKKSRLGLRYNIWIPNNVAGYGLRLLHISGGGGMLLNAKHIGNYCGVNAGVLCGNKDSQENTPWIGNYVALGPGVKVIGKVRIGDNVFVAANAVVVKDIQSNSIAGGIPAGVIKQRPPIDENSNYIKFIK